MILYHGSNIEIHNSKIIKSKRLLDFGTGFYLTSDFNQAERWAKRTAGRRNEGYPTVSVFHLAESDLKKLNTRIFESADTDWLDYVSKNRTDLSFADSYDIVIGPVANDQAFRTINNYLNGYLTKDIALQLLLPQNLKDQYTFKTEKALACLKFIEVKKHDTNRS